MNLCFQLEEGHSDSGPSPNIVQHCFTSMSVLSDTSPHTLARPALHTCHDYGRASALCHIKYPDLRNKTSASITRGEIVQLESVIEHCLVSVQSVHSVH